MKAPRRQERRSGNTGTVRARDDDHAFLRIEAVHLDEQRIQRLLALVVAAANAMAAVTADRVNLVDENDARGRFLALLEHVADARGANAYEHFHEIGAADRKEWDIRFARDGARQQRLAGARRSDQKNALGNAAAEFLEFFWITQKLDELLHFILCFLDTGDIAKCDFVFVAGEHARFRFA